MRLLLLSGVWLLSAAFVSTAPAQETLPRETTIFAPKAGRFAVRHPATWQRILRPRESADSLTLEPDSKRAALVLFFYPHPKEGLPDEAALEKTARALAQPFLASMVEQTPVFSRLESSSGRGIYTTLTDKKLVGVKSPKAGEFLYLTHGLLSLGDRMVMFGVLHHDRESAEWKEALRIVSEGLVQR